MISALGQMLVKAQQAFERSYLVAPLSGLTLLILAIYWSVGPEVPVEAVVGLLISLISSLGPLLALVGFLLVFIFRRELWPRAKSARSEGGWDILAL